MGPPVQRSVHIDDTCDVVEVEAMPWWDPECLSSYTGSLQPAAPIGTNTSGYAAWVPAPVVAPPAPLKRRRALTTVVLEDDCPQTPPRRRRAPSAPLYGLNTPPMNREPKTRSPPLAPSPGPRRTRCSLSGDLSPVISGGSRSRGRFSRHSSMFGRGDGMETFGGLFAGAVGCSSRVLFFDD